MFYDMALLVDEQGEMIDRIEHNVENAAVHVDVGRKEIRVAVQFQRKNRRVSNDYKLSVSLILSGKVANSVETLSGESNMLERVNRPGHNFTHAKI